jgi:hypothetical protein
MAKDTDGRFNSSNLGDLTHILDEHSVSDLSWLDIDEDEYRKFEALPKPNFDIIPEVHHELSKDRDERVPSLVPTKYYNVVNVNPLERSEVTTRAVPVDIRNKVAHYIMAGMQPNVIAEKLRAEFHPRDLQLASEDVKPVLEERGLLGNVYINSDHFVKCAQKGEHRKFVEKNAKRALFVLASEKCINCTCNKNGSCSSFNKRLVDEVPYNSKTFDHYAGQLEVERRIDRSRISSTVSNEECRKIIKSGFLLTPVQRGESVKTVNCLPKQSSVEIPEGYESEFLNRRQQAAQIEAMPSVIYLKAAKKLTLGSIDAVSIASSSSQELRSLVKEHGIIGHTYLDMDALGGCRKTLDIISSKGLKPDFILRRSSGCSVCHCTSDGACSKLNKVSSIVTSKPDMSRNLFVSALERAASQGRISHEMVASAMSKISSVTDSSVWASLISKVNLYQPPVVKEIKQYGGQKNSGLHFLSSKNEVSTVDIDPEIIRRDISHFMNTGLYGKKLQAAILSKYSRSDLVKHPELGSSLAANEIVQGDFFIDPTAYSDYGKGCTVGSKRFNKRGPKNILASSKCTGCTLQTAPGWCSKYAKSMVRSVPSDIRTAAKERRALQMIQDPAPEVENPIEKYEISSELTFDVGDRKKDTFEITVSRDCSFDDSLK